MIAILEYGQFTAQIQLPSSDPMYMVRVMKPMSGMNYIPIDELDVSKPEKHILEFKLKDRLTKDIWLYEFVGEA